MKLSHILPPNSVVSSNPDVLPSSAETPCPGAIIGNVPASTALHLAIAHQIGEHRCAAYSKNIEEGVDDLTISDSPQFEEQNPIRSTKTLIIASERSRWHESLLDENDAWLRDHGGAPEISDALRRVEIKYCSMPKDAMILLALLHAPENGQAVGAMEDASVISGGVPDLIITWDLFSLFVEHYLDGEPGSSLDGEGKGRGERVLSLRADSTVQDYLALLSMLRQAIDQITPQETSRKPEFIILEPNITSSLELPVSHPQAASDATNTVERKHEKRLKVVMGLQSIIAPGYRDEAKGDSVLEIREADDSAVYETEQQSTTRRGSLVSTLSGGRVAAFEQRQEEEAPGKPWLDRVATKYTWI